MKKLRISIAIIASLLQASCGESGEIRRNIHGMWRVESITFMTRMGVDSVWEFDHLTFEFERCSRRQNKGSEELCKLFAQDGQNQTVFEYRVTPEGQLFFDLSSPHIPSKFDEVLISPNFDIVTLTDTKLFIRNQGGRAPAYTEIRAERQ